MATVLVGVSLPTAQPDKGSRCHLCPGRSSTSGGFTVQGGGHHGGPFPMTAVYCLSHTTVECLFWSFIKT